MNLTIDTTMRGPMEVALDAARRQAAPTEDRPEARPVFGGADEAEISPEARDLLEKLQAAEESESAGRTDEETAEAESSGRPSLDLSEEEKEEVRDLEARDREVRAHEQAHAAAGGAHVRGGPSYEFETGPDGKSYAVEGHVSIDVSPEKDPRATIAKMQQVKRAAMAPAQPSGADRQVAARATAEEAKARQQLQEETSEAVRSSP